MVTNYRPEIDGLRAVAVLSVILFHAGHTAFSGGFVGVDIFFVISGYLITNILYAELKAGSFNIWRFYEHRARRILPAIFVMLAACLPFAWYWLLPAELESFSKSLAAVAVFSSNFVFWRGTGYFETASELTPLMHTWSLAVEEQYYLLFPLFLLMAWRRGRRACLYLLLAAAVASFAAGQWGSFHKPQAAFYLLATRAWELLAGAILAVLFQQQMALAKPPALARETLGIAGLLIILGSVLLYDRATPSPGLYTLVPVIGAMLVIGFGQADTLVGRLLSGRILVGIGLVSYSAYLWHQPLFAFARHRSMNEPSPVVMGLLVGATMVLAYASWKFVEGPFRDPARINRRQIINAGLFGSIFFVSVGLIGIHQRGFEDRFDAKLTALFHPPKTDFESKCKLSAFAGMALLKKCEFGAPDGGEVFVLYGDSHAQALFTELDAALTKKGVKGVFVTNQACLIPGILDSRTKVNVDDCDRTAAYLYAWAQREVTYFAVSLRWTYRLYPVRRHIESLVFDNGENGVEMRDAPRENFTLLQGTRNTLAEGKAIAMRDFIDKLSASVQQLILVYPIPEVGWNIPKVNFYHSLTHQAPLREVSTSFRAFNKRNAFVENTLDAIETQTPILRVRPSAILCDTYVKGRCAAQVEQVPLYYDDDHLSNAGARLIVREMLRRLPP